MENMFNVQGMAGLPWSPMSWWQANMQMLGRMQQTWLEMLIPGKSGLGDHWTGLSPVFSAFMPFVPRIEATITPLKKEGKLAGVNEASRVTMRLTLPLPMPGGKNAPEIVLVDAVVARMAGEGKALPLDDVGFPALGAK